MHEIILFLSTVGRYAYHEVLNNIPAILAFIGGGGLLSVHTQVTKRLKAWDSADVIHKFVLVWSAIYAASGYLIVNYSTRFAHATTPFIWYPAAIGTLFTLATFLHKYPVNQLDALVTGKLGPLFAAAAELRASSKPLNTTANEAPTTNEVL